MDLEQLRFFVHVAELGSFAKAADLLDVPQPTLSRQVRTLETEVRASLLHRHGRGVTVTSAGARFLARAKGLLHSAEAALAELHEGDAQLRGRVACGLTASVGRMMIPTFVGAFRQQLPHAELTVVNQLSAQLHDYLRAARIDFAILHNPPPVASVHVEFLLAQDLHLVGRQPVGPDPDQVDMKLLAGVPLVTTTPLHVTRQPLELAAAQQRIKLDLRYEVDAIDSLFELVDAGFAHTVATGMAVNAGWKNSGLVRQRIVNPSIRTELFLASPHPQDRTPLQEHAISLARSVFGARARAIAA